jgi:hypothetical protein
MSLAIGVLVIGVLGIFAFEFVRYTIMRDQLRTATDAAALGAAATLAGSNFSSPPTAQTNAMSVATKIFKMNGVMGRSLDNLVAGPEVAAHEATLGYTWFDRNGVSKPFGSPDGKVIKATAKYGFTPLFGAFLGMNNFVAPITVASDGGVPPLDIVLCFDLSGSMDDQTRVTLVKRYEDGGVMHYDDLAHGTIFNMMNADNSGSPVNAFYPQRLDYAASEPAGYTFNPTIRGAGEHAPPGAGTPGANEFTDLVVNIASDDTNPEQMTSWPITVGGKTFNNLGSVVEAARGNLESSGVRHDSHADLGTDMSAASSGFKTAYEEAVKPRLNPMSICQTAVVDFFKLMNVNADSHFGLITFGCGGDIAAQKVSLENYTISAPRVGAGYTCNTGDPDPMTCKLPMVPLNLTNNNFTDLETRTLDTGAYSCTFLIEAANEAVDQLKDTTLSRPDAKRAVVLFTDGFANGSTDITTLVDKAKAAGVPIYCVGLQQDPSVEADQRAFLDPIADGTKGKAYYTNNSNELKALFALVARNLTQLVRIP